MLWRAQEAATMAQKPSPAKPSKCTTAWGLGLCDPASGSACLPLAVVIASILTLVFLLQALVVARAKCLSPSLHTLSTVVAPWKPTPPHHQASHPADLARVVFAIAAAAKNWPTRKHYIKLWYSLHNKTRAVLWLDQELSHNATTPWDDKAYPPARVSEDITKVGLGIGANLLKKRAVATRIARVVAETVRMGMDDVDWFVMGDDDTFFLPENVAHVLGKYDCRERWYVGSNSETHWQNHLFSFNMAFGGGGFAVSAVLAKELASMQDGCLARYPDLYGSDERIFVCMSELGVPLTKELGFHQMDIRGNPLGMLASHPVAPFVSLHHMDMIGPIFPGLSKRASLDHLVKAAKVESASVFQQAMCYAAGLAWSFSVSWGYVVQVYPGFVRPRELQTPLRTFSTLQRGSGRAEFPFNTRELPKEPCQRPAMFYMKAVRALGGAPGELESVHWRNEDLKVTRPACEALRDLATVQRIRVLKAPAADSWFQAPRRSCCRVEAWTQDSIELRLHECQPGETLLTSSSRH